MDVFDTTGYFSRRIPLLASNNELLKYSICSISAKHLQRIYGGEEVLFDRLGGVVENGEIDYEYLSVAYYDKAITRLKPRVESLAANEMLIHSSASTEEILAAIAILCQYELMDTPGVAWTVHLGAVHLLVKEARIDIPECSIVTVPRAAIQGPVFWSLARQDILCACQFTYKLSRDWNLVILTAIGIGETQTRLKIENLQLWHHAGLASADNHLQPPTSPGSLTEYSSVSDIPEDMKAKDLICMLSKLINFVTAGDALVPEDYARPEGHRLTVAVAQELLLKRWQAIEIDLRHWHTTLPSSFVPKTYAKGDLQTALSQKVPHKTFPKICYEAPICAAAILSFHMACILLYSNRPQESTAIRSTVSARLQSYREDARHALFHARQICGIVVLERSATVLVHAVHPLFLAGQVFIDQDEQQAVIILLENIEQSFGWSTSYLIQKLREDWDARSLR